MTKIHGGLRRSHDKIKQDRKKLMPHKFKFYINKQYKFNKLYEQIKQTYRSVLVDRIGVMCTLSNVDLHEERGCRERDNVWRCLWLRVRAH